MQRQPFPGKLEKNLLEVAAPQGAVDIFNGLLDKAGGVHKRPGLYENQAINQMGGIQALYYWPAKKKTVAVAGGQIWATNSLSEPFVQVSNISAVLAQGPAKIIDTGYWLYFHSTSGGMAQWNGVDEAIRVPDGVAPTNVSTMTTLNRRVIANELGTNRIWYTRPADLETPELPLEWEGNLEVGRTSEDVIGLETSGGELIVFKQDAFQAFYDDGVVPYKPLLGSVQAFGLVSASALVKRGNVVYFTAPDRTIYSLENKSVENLSFGEMHRALAKLKATNDCILTPLDNLILATFTADRKTLVYDTILKTWSQFTSFIDGSEREFVARAATTFPSADFTNLWAIGGRDGGIYFWDAAAMNDAGNPIHVLIRTAHQGWGTSNRKHTTRLVAKVSTEPLRTYPLPDINFPNATRCTVYSYSLTLPVGYTATIVGLPTGFTAVQVGQELTVAGIVGNFAGNAPIIVRLKDPRGYIFTQSKAFIVEDYDIEIGVAP